MNNNNMHHSHDISGTITTGILMLLSVALNLISTIDNLGQVFHLIASCATIGAACTTICVGLLTIKKLKKEK